MGLRFGRWEGVEVEIRVLNSLLIRRGLWEEAEGGNLFLGERGFFV